MKITASVKEANGIFTLMRDGSPAICPFRDPIVLPGQLAGQIQIVPSTCNSQCPFFQLDIDPDVTNIGEIQLDCGYKTLRNTVDIISDSARPSNSIKLH